MKKKALIVVNLAGFLHFLWNDIATLQEMGYEVSVAMNENSAAGPNLIEIPKLEEMGIAHYQVEFDTKSPVSTQNIQAYKQLKLILKTNKYDLIHCHTPIVGILTRMAARKYRKTGTIVIYTTHGFTFTDKSSKKNWIVYFTAEKLMSRFCDAIITINHEDYNNAKKMHCPKTYIIPSVGLDNHRFANLRINRDEYRASFGVNSKDHMILAVGELSSRKNQKIIIEALGTLDRKEQYIFVICGTAVVNSTIEEELKETASKLGVRIFLAGHRLDIPEINACADVAVIPSVREGFGMTGVEALASGVPVVGSDVQGIREYVIPGKTGYLCDPYDAHQFADAIEKIVNLPSEERAKMVIACKEKAKEFDVSKSIAAMKNIYQKYYAMTENKIVRDKMPLVSVVVPIYNVELYLKECVDSILSQTYKNIEVILVDDESPDLCGKICDDYAAMDGRIKVVHKKNGGLSDARNAGMKVATGDLITFVDSDDYISKDFVKILFEAMSENNSDIAIANMKRTSRRDDKNTVIDWKVSSYKNEDALIRMLYGTPFGTSACGKLFKRSLFTGVEFPYGKFSEDLFTIYKTILKSENVTYVGFDGYFYYYRDEGSIVVSGYKEKHLEALDAIDDIVRAVKGKTQFDNALSTQYINVVYDIAARNPQLSEFQNKRIQSVLKSHRMNVLKDGNAPKRLRAFAAISLFGNRIALKVVVARNRKWKA